MEAPPNPLRPYYSGLGNLGALPTSNATTSTPPPASSYSSKPSYPGYSSSNSYSSHSHYFDDVGGDWNITETVQNLAQVGLTNYGMHSLNQPFENAMLLLQVRVEARRDAKKKVFVKEMDEEFEQEDDETTKNVWDDEEKSGDESDDSDTPYFDDQLPTKRSKKDAARDPPARRRPTNRTGYIQEDSLDSDDLRPSYRLPLTSNAGVLAVIKSTWTNEGLFGIWKGNNSSYIYTLLFETIQPYTSTLLSTLLGHPDFDLSNITTAEHPLTALTTIAASFALTSLILAPLDIARIKLILTPISSLPRGLWPTLKSLPTGLTCPPSLIFPTILHALTTSLPSHITPLLFKSTLPSSPFTHSLIRLVSNMLQLALEMPVETVLRRGQVEAAKPEKTVVQTGRYAGVLGTVWMVCKEGEGAGEGLGGLYRGWKMAAWANLLSFVAGVSIVGEEEF